MIDQEQTLADSDEISLKEVILKIMVGWNYLLTKWVIILIAGAIGGLLGLAYAYLKKPAYTASSTFVLEDTKIGGGLAQYAGLASLAGIDIGGAGGGVFQGDNILELYKSRAMIEKALLSTVNINGRNQLLIDRYIDFYGLRAKWKRKDNINPISFYGDPQKFNRKQDSIIIEFVKDFNLKILDVTKPDKKLNIIKVDVTSEDELFSKEFNIRLVETVNNFYTQTKTKKSYQNVQILQRQADSVKRVLNSSISGVALAIDAAPNPNTSLLTLRVPSQKKQIDVQANTAIYSELVKNLELSKISYRQETPLIQVVDVPIFPLETNKPSKAISILAGGVSGVFLLLLFLISNKLFKKIMY